MGMFDTVLVSCPNCRHKEQFQTKSGECTLREIDLEECPVDMLLDINRHSPHTCEQCGTQFKVEFEITITKAKSVIA